MAPVEASNVVPSLAISQLNENVPKRVAGNAPKGDLLGNLPKENRGRLKKLVESSNLNDNGSWDEQQQQSVRDLLTE